MQDGHTNVFNLEGSIFMWASKGRLLELHSQAVHKVHPFDSEWGRLLPPALRSDRANAGDEALARTRPMRWVTGPMRFAKGSDRRQGLAVRMDYAQSGPEARGGAFATTHWSVVLAAGQSADAQASAALEQLCLTYGYPLYAYVRRRGFSHEDAQVLTQAFFAHLLRKDFLDGVGPEKGRFRSFLLGCLKHFLVDEWEKARTAKRGGNCPALPLDMEKAEERYHLEGRVEADSESLFERRWALDQFEHVLDRLRHEARTQAGGQYSMNSKAVCWATDRTLRPIGNASGPE